MANLDELHYWHTNSYGQAIRISKKRLQTYALVLCMITPATNWIIPFIKKLITQDAIFRY